MLECRLLQCCLIASDAANHEIAIVVQMNMSVPIDKMFCDVLVHTFSLQHTHSLHNIVPSV